MKLLAFVLLHVCILFTQIIEFGDGTIHFDDGSDAYYSTQQSTLQRMNASPTHLFAVSDGNVGGEGTYASFNTIPKNEI